MTTASDVQNRLGGRYEIERELGRGGMGAVFLARDVKLGRPVALKVLPAEYATSGAAVECAAQPLAPVTQSADPGPNLLARGSRG